jgi:hypothetical protein
MGTTWVSRALLAALRLLMTRSGQTERRVAQLRPSKRVRWGKFRASKSQGHGSGICGGIYTLFCRELSVQVTFLCANSSGSAGLFRAIGAS